MGVSNNNFRFTDRLANVKYALFITAYAIFFVNEILLKRSGFAQRIGTSTANQLSLVSHLLFLMFCATIMLFTQSYTLYQLVVLVGMFFAFAVSSYFSKSYNMFDLFMLIGAAQKIDFKKFMQSAVKIQSVVISFIIVLSIFGVINSGNIVRKTGEMRRALGFNHPNTLGVLVYQLSCEWIYLKKDKKQFSKYIMIFIMALIIYLITDSNTSFLLILMVIAFNFIYEVVDNNFLSQAQLKKIIKVAVAVMTLGIILVVRYYWNHPDRLKATTMVTRINLAKKYIIAYGVNLFGHNITTGYYTTIPGFKRGYYYLDNAYVWLAIQFGIVVCIFILISFVKTMRMLIRIGEWNLFLIFFTYAIYGLSEHAPFLLMYNSMLVVFSCTIYKNHMFRKYIIKDDIQAVRDNIQTEEGNMQIAGDDIQAEEGNMQIAGDDIQAEEDVQMSEDDMQVPEDDMWMSGNDMQMPVNNTWMTGNDVQVPVNNTWMTGNAEQMVRDDMQQAEEDIQYLD